MLVLSRPCAKAPAANRGLPPPGLPGPCSCWQEAAWGGGVRVEAEERRGAASSPPQLAPALSEPKSTVLAIGSL